LHVDIHLVAKLPVLFNIFAVGRLRCGTSLVLLTANFASETSIL